MVFLWLFCFVFISCRAGATKYKFCCIFLILSLEPKYSPSQIHFKPTFYWLHNILKCKCVILSLTNFLLLGIWVVPSFVLFCLFNKCCGWFWVHDTLYQRWAISALAEGLLCARHCGRLEDKLDTILSPKMQI